MTLTFLDPPVHYALPEFRVMLSALKLGDWRPRFPTLHNTGVPSLAQWLAYGPTPSSDDDVGVGQTADGRDRGCALV